MQHRMPNVIRVALAAVLSCLAVGPALLGVPPEEYQGTFRLGSASAPRGGEVRLPFFINSTPGTGGFTFSIDFDEEVLEAGTEMERVFQLPGGGDWEFAAYNADNSNETPGNGGVEEGHMRGGVVFKLTEDAGFPVGTDTEVIAFTMRVKPKAPLGATEVQFLDGAPHAGGSVRNRIELAGKTVPPDTKITPVFVQARLQIVPDVSIFVRGDANGDAAVDIADAHATLNYLFRAGDPLPCLDAADANDDGKLNIGDPITTLQVLFLGRGPLPPPSGAGGEDPTSDALDCTP